MSAYAQPAGRSYEVRFNDTARLPAFLEALGVFTITRLETVLTRKNATAGAVLTPPHWRSRPRSATSPTHPKYQGGVQQCYVQNPGLNWAVQTSMVDDAAPELYMDLLNSLAVG